jgi:hypothetical protein
LSFRPNSSGIRWSKSSSFWRNDCPAVRRVLEERLPVDALDQLLHLVGRVAARVEAADDRAHARADDVVDRDVQLLEAPDDADVGHAARAAAAEREADAASARRGRGGRRLDSVCGSAAADEARLAASRLAANRDPEARRNICRLA